MLPRRRSRTIYDRHPIEIEQWAREPKHTAHATPERPFPASSRDAGAATPMKSTDRPSAPDHHDHGARLNRPIGVGQAKRRSVRERLL